MEILLMILAALSWLMSLALAFLGGSAMAMAAMRRTVNHGIEAVKETVQKAIGGFDDK